MTSAETLPEITTGLRPDQWRKRDGSLDKRCKVGRDLARREAEIVRALHREPSAAERRVVERLAALERVIDHYLDHGGVEAGSLAALLTRADRMRRDLNLSLRPPPPKVPSLDDHLRALAARENAA